MVIFVIEEERNSFFFMRTDIFFAIYYLNCCRTICFKQKKYIERKMQSTEPNTRALCQTSKSNQATTEAIK